MSGSTDKNHLIADCMRAGGRDLERAVDVALELIDDEAIDSDRRVEAVIVAAAIQEEIGQGGSARRLVERALAGLAGEQRPSSDARVRLLWFAADVAVREGTVERARAFLHELLTLDGSYPDARERLAELSRGE